MTIDQLVDPFLKISEEIAFNSTLLIQLVIFLAVYFILKPLLWTPTLAVIDRRKQLTEGQKEAAGQEEAELLRLEAEYKKKLQAARQAANEERGSLRTQGTEEAKSILDKARNEANSQIAKIRGEVEQASQQARKDLKAQAESTADAMTAKLLGKSAS